eukprot:SAG11_NODE_12821_length_683_cov_1.232877_2_plen_101_part_00
MPSTVGSFNTCPPLRTKLSYSYSTPTKLRFSAAGMRRHSSGENPSFTLQAEVQHKVARLSMALGAEAQAKALMGVGLTVTLSRAETHLLECASTRLHYFW